MYKNLYTLAIQHRCGVNYFRLPKFGIRKMLLPSKFDPDNSHLNTSEGWPVLPGA